MKKIMKTVWLSYLHLSNILLSWIKFLSWIVESSFSTQLKCLSSTSQLNSTLFQKNFNLTHHFSSQVLNLNLSTRLNAISLNVSYRRDCKTEYWKAQLTHSSQLSKILNDYKWTVAFRKEWSDLNEVRESIDINIQWNVLKSHNQK